MEGEYLSSLKKMLEGELYDEKGKRGDKGTISNPNHNLGGHIHLCNF
jgi:hypothetical protein